MNDLISRQAAINAIYALSNRPIAWLESAVDEIEALPSAQPEAEERMPETEQNVPNNELISKEAAIDVADAVWGVTVEKNFAKAWDQIKELPSAQPGWIPCNDLLPECPVLCCDNRGDYLIAIPFLDESSSTGYSAENDECYMYDCIAWMPLPEPYKEDLKHE